MPRVRPSVRTGDAARERDGPAVQMSSKPSPVGKRMPATKEKQKQCLK